MSTGRLSASHAFLLAVNMLVADSDGEPLSKPLLLLLLYFDSLGLLLKGESVAEADHLVYFRLIPSLKFTEAVIELLRTSPLTELTFRLKEAAFTTLQIKKLPRDFNPKGAFSKKRNVKFGILS
nr:hypothetical protein HmN_000958000 [Hymenolepis microstoma]